MQIEDRPFETVKVTISEGIAWVLLNRPGKQNAINPQMNEDMIEVLNSLELDDRCKVVVLTGAGNTFTAGMDIKEYFRATDDMSILARDRVFRLAAEWQWRRLLGYPKPTIAMVNGWCLGGGFVPLLACDLAIASEDAQFGLSEINWGIIPAGNVAKALSTVVSARAALYYIMTGLTFDGRRALELGLVNLAVKQDELRDEVMRLATQLMSKNPVALRQAKMSYKNISDLSWEMADDYLRAKQDQVRFQDRDNGRDQGMRQFLDEKAYRPGVEGYKSGG